MNSFEPKKFERYLIYPNESIDRLTTNRTFQRIYEDIEKHFDTSKMSLSSATEFTYGKAKFSSASGFSFEEPSENASSATTADYYDNMLRPSAIRDFSISMSDNVENSMFVAATSDNFQTPQQNKYWIKNDCGNVDFTYLPNGVNFITGTMEIGFNDILAMFDGNRGVLSGDILSPVDVNGYETYIRFTDEDKANLDDYTVYGSHADRANVKLLKKLDGIKVKIPYTENFEATVKHNICNWTTYSSYKQSFVELHLSSSLDIKSLYESKYGKDSFSMYGRKGKSSSADINTRSTRHPNMIFEQKPIVMMQVGFYNDDTKIRPTFGYDNRNSTDQNKESEFNSYDTVSQQPLTVNTDNPSISPVNGYVMVKKFENEYNDDGLVVNNIIHFDTVMKFMVGSAADPKMIHGLTSINARAKLQYALIGV